MSDARAIRVDAFVRAFVSFRFVSSRVFLDGDDDVDDDDGDANANAGIDDDSWATRRGGVRTRGDDASLEIEVTSHK